MRFSFRKQFCPVLFVYPLAKCSITIIPYREDCRKEVIKYNSSRFRYYVLHRLPNLKFLDSTAVKLWEKKEAARRGAFLKVVRPVMTEEADIVRISLFLFNQKQKVLIIMGPVVAIVVNNCQCFERILKVRWWWSLFVMCP